MIEIKIPKEINKYEAKLIGSFTTRQTICLCIIAVVCISAFNILRPLLGQDVASFIAMALSVFPALCGWYKPYGMPFEQFIKSAFINAYIAPAKRKYKTENTYEKLNQINNKNNNTKIKKTKYKKSKQAIK